MARGGRLHAAASVLLLSVCLVAVAQSESLDDDLSDEGPVFHTEKTKEFYLPNVDVDDPAAMSDALKMLELDSTVDESTAAGAGGSAAIGASTEETAVSGVAVNLTKADTKPAPIITQLSCKCESYNCYCRKECLCKVAEQPFNGKKIKAEKAKGKGKSSASKSALVFKCACDFGGADFTISDKQGLNCDCSGAKCKCQKKCVCKHAAGAKSKAAAKKASFREIFPANTAPRFEEDAPDKGPHAQPAAPAAAAPEARIDGASLKFDDATGTSQLETDMRENGPLLDQGSARASKMAQQRH